MINLIKNKWGSKKPLLINLIIILFITMIVIYSTPSDSSILNYLNENNEVNNKPTLSFNGFISRSESIDQSNLIQFSKSGKNIQSVNENQSYLYVRHEDIISVDEQETSIFTYYIDQTKWTEFGVGNNTRVLYGNFNKPLSNDNVTYFSKFLSQSFHIASNESEEINSFMFGQIINLRGSNNIPFIIFKIDVLNDLSNDLIEDFDASWQITYNLFMEEKIYSEFEKVSQLSSETINIEHKIEKVWFQLFSTSSSLQVSYPLLSTAYDAEQSGLRKFEFILDISFPFLVFFELLALYLYYKIFVNSRKRLNLLFNRGFSRRQLLFDLIKWNSFIPTTISAISGFILLKLFGPTKIDISIINPYITWYIIQIPFIIVLSLREIRQLKELNRNQLKNKQEVSIKLLKLVLSVFSIYYLLQAVKSFKDLNDITSGASTEQLSNFPQFYGHILNFIFFVSMGIILTYFGSFFANNNGNILTRLEKNYVRKSIILLSVVILISAHATSNFVVNNYYSENSYMNEGEMFDYKITLNGHNASSFLMNSDNLDKLRPLGDIFPRLKYRTELHLNDIDFSVSITLLNQFYLNKFLSLNNQDNINLTDRLWVDPALYSYIHDTTSKIIINSQTLDLSKISQASAILEQYVGEDSYLLSDNNTWKKIFENINDPNRINDEIAIFIRTHETLSTHYIESWIIENTDFDDLIENIIPYSTSFYNRPNTEFNYPFMIFSFYAVIAGIILSIIWLYNPTVNQDLEYINYRFGDKISKSIRNYLFRISLQLSLFGVIGGIVLGFTVNLRMSRIMYLNGFTYEFDYPFYKLIFAIGFYITEIFGILFLVKTIKEYFQRKG